MRRDFHPFEGPWTLPNNESNANSDPRLKELVKLCATYAMVPEKVRITIRKYAEFFLKQLRGPIIIGPRSRLRHFEQKSMGGKSEERATILKALSEEPPDGKNKSKNKRKAMEAINIIYGRHAL